MVNDTLRDEKARLEEALANLEREYNDLREKLNRLQREHDRLKDDLKFANKTLEDLEAENAQLAKENDALKQQNGNLKRSINELSDQNDQLKRDLEAMPQQQEGFGQQQSQFEPTPEANEIVNEEVVSQQEYDELKALLDALKAAKADVEKERDAFQQEHILLHKKISKLEVDLEGAGNKRDEYKRLLTEAERRIRELEGINARFTDREKELQEERLNVHNEVSGLQQQIILLKIRLSKAEADRGNYEDKIDKLNKEINDLHQRLSQITS
jgi:chromosome segregation ATPase